jgi:ABC-type glycerol-3-phosphate transport system substrate-binding protein
MYRKLVYIISVLILTIFLIACSQDSSGDNPELSSTDSPVSFIAERIPLSAEDGGILSVTVSENGKVSFLMATEDKYSIRTYDRDKLFTSQNPNTLSTGTVLARFDDEYTSILFSATDSSIILVRVIEPRINVTKFDMHGAVQYDIDLDFQEEFEVFITSVATDSYGRAYVAWSSLITNQSGVSVISEQGEVLYTLSGNYNSMQLAVTSSDIPIALIDNQQLREIDINNRSWGASKNLEDSFYNIFTGLDGIVHLSTITELYSYNTTDNSLIRQFDYSLLGIPGYPMWLIQIAPDEYLIGTFGGMYHIYPDSYAPNEDITSDNTSDDNNNIQTPRPIRTPRPEDNRTSITIALTTPVDLLISTAISEFNAQNEEYRIDIREIRSIDLLRTELAVGRVPDIIYYGNRWCLLRTEVPAHRLNTRGLLANLYDFIDEDPELSRESFIPTVLDAIAREGHLYELPYQFWIDLAVGDATRLGDRLGWSFDDMIRILERTEFDGYILNPYTTQRSVLYSMLLFLIDDFINWETATAHFDSSDFIKLLEIVKKYAPYDISDGEPFYEWDMIAEGKQLMMWQTMSEPNYLQLFDFHFEKMVPIGFPVSHGVGNAFNFDGSFSISSVSEHQDVAWSFIRQFYIPSFWEKNRGLIPVNVEALETWYSVTDNWWSIGLGDATITIEGNTAYDVERTRRIIDTTTRIARLDSDIWIIVSEEADAFFRDIRSAADAARIIQNRVQTLVWEQSG